MNAAAVSESSQGARRGRDPPFGDTPHPHAYPPIEGAPEDLGESFGSPARRGNSGHDFSSSSTSSAVGPILSPPGRMWPQYLACLSATIGSLVMGTAIGWSGPALTLIRDHNKTDLFLYDEEKDFLINNAWFNVHGMDDFEVTDVEANFIASLMPLGALFGGPISGYLIGRLGRRSTMFITASGFTLFYLLLTCAVNVWMILIARFFIGVMSGLTSIAAPVYIAETSSAHVRGMLGSGFQLMVTIGVLYVDILGYFGSWRWLTVGCLLSCVIWAISLLFVPETPAFLLQRRKFDEARDAMEFLRGHAYIEAELEEISNSLQRNNNSGDAGFLTSMAELFTLRQNLQPLLISLTLMFGQQMSGVNAVIFFSVNIFEAAGTDLNSFIENIIVGCVQVLGTVLAALIIDRTGRRKLLSLSAIVMSASAIGLGTYFYILDTNPAGAKALGFLPLTSLCVFIFSFSLGFGPIPWLMMGELFRPEIKEKASSIAACCNWSLAFLVTQFYGPLVDLVGKAATFWTFATFLIFIFIFCVAFVPETKGRTLEEIQRLFRGDENDNDRNALVQNVGGPDSNHADEDGAVI